MVLILARILVGVGIGFIGIRGSGITALLRLVPFFGLRAAMIGAVGLDELLASLTNIPAGISPSRKSTVRP